MIILMTYSLIHCGQCTNKCVGNCPLFNDAIANKHIFHYMMRQSERIFYSILFLSLLNLPIV